MGNSSDSFYITTPIYYVNDKPHIGHSYTTILADVLARYARLRQIPSFFLTGTDEHGQKVQDAALKRGVTPQQHVDEMTERFRELWKRLEVTNDDYIRTTQERHTAVVQAILQDLYDRDEIYAAEYDGWYCVSCERFYTEKDLIDGNCPAEGCGRAVTPIKEKNYFFRMGNYQEWLIGYINDNPGFIQPDFRRNETLGFLKKPLTDLCISRPKSRLEWGIELPFDKDFVTYVWFDALVNYISAVGYRSDDEKFAQWWPASYHVIGKDILTTHTVYWPTMLKAMGVPMPRTVFAHGWWLAGKDRMSKSAGNAVNPMDMIDAYGVDAFRYFLLAEMTVGQDAGFTEDAFILRYNTDLANDLGNLVNRVVKLIGTGCGGAIPQPGEGGADEDAVRSAAVTAATEAPVLVAGMKTDAAVALVGDVVRATNRYMENTKPWVLAKEGDTDRLGTVLYTAAEALRIVSGLLTPVMPGKMAELRRVLGLPAEVHAAALAEWGSLKPGTAVTPVTALFPRIDVKKKPAPEAPKPKQKKQKKQPQQDDGIITIDDFKRVKLRTAVIVAAERDKGSEKLLKLRVKLGDEERPLVAGVALHYAPDDLIGKEIVVVANLKPAKIRGNVSQGMLLAATAEDGSLAILSPDKSVGGGRTVG